ncbi:PREDICTED: armadillo repeat-containing protein 7 [Rhinopithecus bieti]|uniref:armadillo repeat-containing protein 7 n=1 Tax=Rhinopithecus bieti TaxID=61621 RepID=UPI00083C3A77|nr:PREDICTED: armadillo repeat-containing protein 7 [Rhinopithecus bieti]
MRVFSPEGSQHMVELDFTTPDGQLPPWAPPWVWKCDTTNVAFNGLGVRIHPFFISKGHCSPGRGTSGRSLLLRRVPKQLVFTFKKGKKESVSAIELAEQRGKGICAHLWKAGLWQAGAGRPFYNREGRSRNGLWIACAGTSFSTAWALPGVHELGSWEEARGYSIQILPWSPTGGLCNLCPDRANKEHILQAGGLPLIINCLSSPNEETVLSAITTLMHLSPPGRSFPPELSAAPVVQCMLRFSLSASARLRNLAQIFLEDFCSPRQVAEARSRQAHSALGIPLPRSMAPRQR